MNAVQCIVETSHPTPAKQNQLRKYKQFSVKRFQSNIWNTRFVACLPTCQYTAPAPNIVFTIWVHFCTVNVKCHRDKPSESVNWSLSLDIGTNDLFGLSYPLSRDGSKSKQNLSSSEILFLLTPARNLAGWLLHSSCWKQCCQNFSTSASTRPPVMDKVNWARVETVWAREDVDRKKQDTHTNKPLVANSNYNDFQKETLHLISSSLNQRIKHLMWKEERNGGLRTANFVFNLQGVWSKVSLDPFCN